MLPRKAGDDVAGELLARGYYRMLGHLTPTQMGWLTELVLDRCKWFPTVAECRALMAEQDYGNPFYNQRLAADHARLGYAVPATVLKLKDDTDADA